MAINSTKQLLPQDGALYDSTKVAQNYFTVVPDEQTTGTDLAKRPSTNSWSVFSVSSGGAGYVTAVIEGTATATSAGTKVRIPLLAYPLDNA